MIWNLTFYGDFPFLIGIKERKCVLSCIYEIKNLKHPFSGGLNFSPYSNCFLSIWLPSFIILYILVKVSKPQRLGFQVFILYEVVIMSFYCQNAKVSIYCKQITDKMSLPAPINAEINTISLQKQLRIARNEINNLR